MRPATHEDSDNYSDNSSVDESTDIQDDIRLKHTPFATSEQRSTCTTTIKRAKNTIVSVYFIIYLLFYDRGLTELNGYCLLRLEGRLLSTDFLFLIRAKIYLKSVRKSTFRTHHKRDCFTER